MNFINKAMVLLCALTLISANVKCMQQGAHQPSQPKKVNQPQKKAAPSVFGKYKNGFDILDYLTQLASIYLIDSTNAGHISKVAAARTVFNAGYILDCINRLLRTEAISKQDIADVGSTYMRGKNVYKDRNNWDNAASIGSNNAGRKNDKNLSQKKLCQYAWLTLNKLLPYAGKRFGIGIGFAHRLLSEVSELYRQKLMYVLIADKKKSA